MRSSRHQVACAARSASGGAAHFEDAGDLADLLHVDPADHVGHRAAVQRRRQEQRGQQLGRRGVPELAVGRRPVSLGGVAQVRGDPGGHRPLGAAGQRRPLVGRGPATSGRIDAPHPAPAGSRSPGVAEQVALDAGGQHRAGPQEDRRHGEARRLAALRRADHHQRLGRLGGEPRAPHARDRAELQASRRRDVPLDQQRAELAPPGPAGAPASGRRDAAAGHIAPRDETPATSAPPSTTGTTTAAMPATR